MELIEKVGSIIAEKGREAVDKTKLMAEIMSLKSQIATCEEVIKKNYLEIGRMFYEEYGSDPDAPFEKQRNAIANAMNGENALKEKIEELKKL